MYSVYIYIYYSLIEPVETIFAWQNTRGIKSVFQTYGTEADPLMGDELPMSHRFHIV